MLDLGRTDQVAEQDRQMAPLALDTRRRFNRRGAVVGGGDCLQSCSAFSTEVSVSGIYGVTGGATILDFRATLHAKRRIGGVVVVASHAPHGGLSCQLVEERLGGFQVGGVVAFGEPVVEDR